MEVHPSARRHGCEADDLLHVLAHVLADQEIDEDPTKRLIIGPDVSGNLLEVVVVELDDRLLAIHAMKLRPRYRYLLREGGHDA